MNVFLIILVMVVLIPYVGSVTLRSLSLSHSSSRLSFENYIVGFSLGQLLLIKIITLLGIFGLINFNSLRTQ